MDVAAEIKPGAQWLRIWDFERVEDELGDLYAGEREAVTEEFEAGLAQAFHAVSEHYEVWLLVRFETRNFDRALQCHVIAIRGRGIEAGRAQLVKLVKQAGCIALTCDADKVGIIKLHTRAGWEIENCRMRLEI